MLEPLLEASYQRSRRKLNSDEQLIRETVGAEPFCPSTSKIRKLLWIKIWRDTSPIWETKYRVEMTASASPLFWGLIVLAILAVVLLVLTWRIVSEVKGIIWGPEGAGGAGIVSGVAWAVAAAAAVVVVGILLVKGRN